MRGPLNVGRYRATKTTMPADSPATLRKLGNALRKIAARNRKRRPNWQPPVVRQDRDRTAGKDKEGFERQNDDRARLLKLGKSKLSLNMSLVFGHRHWIGELRKDIRFETLVKTIVIVMMENRSFDNLLGYLSLPPHARTDVEGLGKEPDWQQRFASTYQGNKYLPFILTDPYDTTIDADPPHERDPIALQMGKPVGGIFPMDGFVANYATAKGAKPPVPGSNPPVMGYFTADQAPVTDFFAHEFAICDHWYSALPAGTQPNRLMAMSGYTLIDVNQVPLPDQELVYDWLTKNGVRWRVYHEELPFMR